MWPVRRASRWIHRVNELLIHPEIKTVGKSAQRGRPLGDAARLESTARQLNLESTIRPRGRPAKSCQQEQPNERDLTRFFAGLSAPAFAAGLADRVAARTTELGTDFNQLSTANRTGRACFVLVRLVGVLLHLFFPWLDCVAFDAIKSTRRRTNSLRLCRMRPQSTSLAQTNHLDQDHALSRGLFSCSVDRVSHRVNALERHSLPPTIAPNRAANCHCRTVFMQPRRVLPAQRGTAPRGKAQRGHPLKGKHKGTTKGTPTRLKHGLISGGHVKE